MSKIEFKPELIFKNFKSKEQLATKALKNEIIRTTDRYVPNDKGTLRASVNPSLMRNDNYIVYDQNYARYLYYGKLMVDPITKKGAFYNSSTGKFWSRPLAKKELTNKLLKYHGGPERKYMWFARAKKIHKESWLKLYERIIKR